MKNRLLGLVLIALSGSAIASSSYTIAFVPTGYSVFCRTTPGIHPNSPEEYYLHISIPLGEVEAEITSHSLKVAMRSEFECQKNRLYFVDAGTQDVEVIRHTATNVRTETERRCIFHGGGGHAGGHYDCRDVRVERRYLDESLQMEVLGFKFVSFQSIRKFN